MIVALTHTNIAQPPWKVNKCTKKRNHGRSYHKVHAMLHLKNNWTEEGFNSVIDSLQAAESKDTKYKEEATEITEQFIIEKWVECFMKKIKGNKTTFVQKKLSSSLSHQDKCFSAMHN